MNFEIQRNLSATPALEALFGFCFRSFFSDVDICGMKNAYPNVKKVVKMLFKALDCC